jgi:hypothetical protein
MALTFTIGAGLVAAKNELDTHQLITAAIGCNVAWGVDRCDAPCARQPVLSQSNKKGLDGLTSLAHLFWCSPQPGMTVRI